jgi:DNA-binding MarR family transcriptional regulator/N-acetylglutamate synthase-like GNAT family acetyltransferase
MIENKIDNLRHLSRKLIRELGMLQLNSASSGQTPQHWHALIEISKQQGLTISRLGHMLLLSVSSMSRIVNVLVKQGYVTISNGADKREKYLTITETGLKEISRIDEFSNSKIKGAFDFLSESEQADIILAIEKYGLALEKSRRLKEGVKILKLSTSRTIRKQIVQMIDHIQKNEFQIPVTDDINSCILRAEDDFYFGNAYNFWYATNEEGTVIGSIGLKRLNASDTEIKKFFVAKEFRGKGVARELLKHALKAASKHGFVSLYLGTVDRLKAAQRFYEKHGFQRIAKKELPKEFDICPVDTEFFACKVSLVKTQ